MPRRIGFILRHPVFAAACLLLSAGAWAAQLARTPNVYWVSPRCSLEIGYGGGGVWVWTAERGTFALLGAGFQKVTASPRRWAPEFRIDRGLVITRLGAGGQRSSIVNGIYASLPAWIAGAAFALPPALLLGRLRRRRPGHCTCGYDLTGVAGRRCPECGQPLQHNVLPEDEIRRAC